MPVFKPVTDPLTGREELHPFEKCAECGRQVDNAIEGYYGHKGIPGLILCQEDYQKKVATRVFEPTRVKVKGKWLNATA